MLLRLAVLSVMSAPLIEPVAAQSWVYLAYSSQTGLPTAPGYVVLEERDGRGQFQIFAGRLDRCYENRLDASVTRTELTTTITVVPAMRGCDEVRFVIKNDGSGGHREIKSGSEWVWDGRERNLTPRR